MKKFITTTILFFMLTSLNWLQSQETTIIYVGDPMCSWCYGFSNEIKEVKKTHSDIEFKLILGGLRPYGTETMADLADFLQHHWEDVSKASGQPFSYDILQNKDFVYDTEPSSRAVIVVRNMKPEIELDFFKAIQKAFYVENKNTTELATFLDIAEKFGLDKDRFAELYESEEIITETKADFQLASQMGIRGFPSMVLKHGEEYTLLNNGYQKAENINAAIEKVLVGK